MVDAPGVNLSLHPKQTRALVSEGAEILYGGAAGGGKSHAMRVVAILYAMGIPGAQVYLFRRLSDDLVKNHVEGAHGFRAMLSDLIDSGHCRYNESKGTFKFWNGSVIWLCHCQHEKDVQKYRGAEIHVLLMDELTHFTDYQYRFLRGRVRVAGVEVPEDFGFVFPRILCGSNPGGVGHTWVKKTFIDPAPYYKIHKTGRTEGRMLRQYIPAVLADNPSLDESYFELLEGLGNEDLVRAMRDGDWDIAAGAFFGMIWSRKKHIVPELRIPAGWHLSRSFDWGSREPFSVGWWAVSNGEEVETLDGEDVYCFPAGSLIRIAEYYGTEGIGTNMGLKMSPHDIAVEILDREQIMRERGVISGSVEPGPADNQIRNETSRKKTGEMNSFAKEFEEAGVEWGHSDKSPGSRVTGAGILTKLLKNALTGELPGLYVVDTCLGFIATIPVIPVDPKKPEDVDTKAEDHIYDEVRYFALAEGAQAVADIDVTFPI